MIEIATNPDVETMKLAVGITGGIISLLLLVVAYFLRQQIEVSKMLTIAVNNLTTAVEVIKKEQDERDPRTERRLNEHAVTLNDHRGRLIRIETRCKIQHKQEEEKE